MSNSGIVSIVGVRDQNTRLDLRFYNHKECKTLINNDKNKLHEWRLSHTNEFIQNKKRTLDPKKQGKVEK